MIHSEAIFGDSFQSVKFFQLTAVSHSSGTLCAQGISGNNIAFLGENLSILG
jgi:hypothetical protein